MYYSIEKKPNILIASPGRICDFIKQKIINVSECESVIFDEADRLFEMGFQKDATQQQMRTSIRPSMRDRTQALKHAFTHTHAHTAAHTHTHTHTQTTKQTAHPMRMHKKSNF